MVDLALEQPDERRGLSGDTELRGGALQRQALLAGPLGRLHGVDILPRGVAAHLEGLRHHLEGRRRVLLVEATEPDVDVEHHGVARVALRHHDVQLRAELGGHGQYGGPDRGAPRQAVGQVALVKQPLLDELDRDDHRLDAACIVVAVPHEHRISAHFVRVENAPDRFLCPMLVDRLVQPDPGLRKGGFHALVGAGEDDQAAAVLGEAEQLLDGVQSGVAHPLNQRPIQHEELAARTLGLHGVDDLEGRGISEQARFELQHKSVVAEGREDVVLLGGSQHIRPDGAKRVADPDRGQRHEAAGGEKQREEETHEDHRTAAQPNVDHGHQQDDGVARRRDHADRVPHVENKQHEADPNHDEAGHHLGKDRDQVVPEHEQHDRHGCQDPREELAPRAHRVRGHAEGHDNSGG
mmetsp:Transcript_24042/g.69167  ORF Transcript_24042/g.69167 Transcript_24042/m.69167 type:complete len:409 (+) Transcript_24042:561-1787(+)